MTFHAKLLPMETVFMKCLMFSGENIINVLSTELAMRVVKVKQYELRQEKMSCEAYMNSKSSRSVSEDGPSYSKLMMSLANISLKR